MNSGAVHRLLQLPPDSVVCGAEVRAVGWPGSWSDEVWGLQVNSCTVSRAL